MKVGFIGLGLMGHSMAANLVTAGHHLVVNSRRYASAQALLAAGAEWAPSAKDVAAACEVVFASLPGPNEVETVALGEDGLLRGMRPGSVFFDLSTNAPSLVRHLHTRFAENGMSMLDAPVSGGKKGAATGKLAIWVSGDRAVFDRYEPVLSAMGDQIRYLGAIGTASTAKLVHNCANYGIQMILAEAFSLGVKAGVDPVTLFSAIRQGSLGRQRIVDRLADQFLPGEFDDPAFALELALKDVSLATELGRENGVPMKFINMTVAEMTEAVNRGWGGRDSRVAMSLQLERANVRLAANKQTLREIIGREPL